MSLPPEWVEKASKSRTGHTYYYNKLTQKVQWHKPNTVEDGEYDMLPCTSKRKLSRVINDNPKVDKTQACPDKTTHDGHTSDKTRNNTVNHADRNQPSSKRKRLNPSAITSKIEISKNDTKKLLHSKTRNSILPTHCSRAGPEVKKKFGVLSQNAEYSKLKGLGKFKKKKCENKGIPHVTEEQNRNTTKFLKTVQLPYVTEIKNNVDRNFADNKVVIDLERKQAVQKLEREVQKSKRKIQKSEGEVQKSEVQKSEVQKLKVQKLEVQKSEVQNLEVQKLEFQKSEVQRLEEKIRKSEGEVEEDEPMDLDDILSNVRNNLCNATTGEDVIKDLTFGNESISVESDLMLILDTNILISDLQLMHVFLDQGGGKVEVMIPWIVVQELDKLKTEGSRVQTKARIAINTLLELKKNNEPSIMFEPRSTNFAETADDRIIQCLHWSLGFNQHNTVVLVSNDKNLRLKSRIEEFSSFSASEILSLLGSTDDETSPGALRVLTAIQDAARATSTPVKPRKPHQPTRQTASPVPRTPNYRPTREPRTPGSPVLRAHPVSDISEVVRVDLRLIEMSGKPNPLDSGKEVARFDKSIVQVFDDVLSSLEVFKEQVATFVETQLHQTGSVATTLDLGELRDFLCLLIPDLLKLISCCTNIANVPEVSRLKQNFTYIVDMVSAVQVYSVHHLHYAPNITPADLFSWLSLPPNFQVVSETATSFSDTLSVIQGSVETLINKKPFLPVTY